MAVHHELYPERDLGRRLAERTGYGPASLLVGTPDSYTPWVGDTSEDQQINWYGFYAQDQWRILKNLVLSFGHPLRLHFVRRPSPRSTPVWTCLPEFSMSQVPSCRSSPRLSDPAAITIPRQTDGSLASVSSISLAAELQCKAHS